MIQVDSVQQVLKPCSVTLETKKRPDKPLSGSVTVEEIIVKVCSLKQRSSSEIDGKWKLCRHALLRVLFF